MKRIAVSSCLSPTRSAAPKGSRPSAVLCRLVVAAGLGLGARDCTHYDSYVVYEFALSACPDSTFALVDNVRSGSYSLRRAKEPERHPHCPAFKVYEFMAEGTFYEYGVFVSFERGPSCRILVAHLYDKGAPELDKRLSELAEWAKTVAQLSMGVHATNLSLTQVGHERVGEREAFQQWCTRPQKIAAVAPVSMPCYT